MPSNFSLNSPGSCSLHLSHTSHSFLRALNSFPVSGSQPINQLYLYFNSDFRKALPLPCTASSTESHDNPKYRLSVSIWMNSWSHLCTNLSKNRNRTAGPRAWPSGRPRSQLEKACQFPLALSLLYFVHVANFFQILKPHQLQIFPQSAFTRCAIHGRLPLQGFYHLSIRAVAQKLEHLGQQLLLWILISLASFLRDFVHEPRENFCGTVYGLVNRCDLQTMVKTPFQHSAYNRIFWAERTPTNFCWLCMGLCLLCAK